MPSLLSIYEIHRNEIWELRPKAEYGDHMMGIQGHPEYTKDTLLNLVDRLVKLDYIDDVEGDELKVKMEAREPDREAWKKICNRFLKGSL